MNKLKEKYEKKIVKELKKEFGRDNIMSIPKLEKIVVNVGMGEAVKNPQSMDKMMDSIMKITGQKPIKTKSNSSISNFGIRVGLEIGMKVTLRRKRMWDFYERLVSVVLPRVKDFRGTPRGSFDSFGNYSLGIKDHTVFPEIDPNKVDKIRSLQITIVTTAKKDEEGFVLLEKLGMPFAKEGKARELDRMKETMEKEKKKREERRSKQKAQAKQARETEEESE